MSSSAYTAIIAGDDTSIKGADQSYDQTFTAFPSSVSGAVFTLDMLEDSGQAEPDENFNYFVEETPLTDSHINLWLLLMVASIFGLVSEVYHRRSINR